MISSIIQLLLLIVEVITALLLIGVILIQRSKSQGMGLAFGSGMGESLFGAQMGNVITRITVILAIVFLANTTLLALMQSGHVEASVTESVTAKAPVMPAGMPAATAPVTPTATPIAPIEATPVTFPETSMETPEVAPVADVPAVAVDVPATPVDVPAAPAVEPMAEEVQPE